jgi:thioredoxin reductase
VAGDNRKKPLRQLVTAAADGTNAAYGAEKYTKYNINYIYN